MNRTVIELAALILLLAAARAQTPLFGPLHRMLPPDCEESSEVVLGDVDGDGDLDAIIGNGHGQAERNRLYLNDGHAIFSDATATFAPAGAGEASAIALEDIDGDGDLDLLMYAGGALLLYLNDGTGSFAAATSQLPVCRIPIHAIAFGDVDRDGDPDALLGGGDFQNGNRLLLYLNDGQGTFADASTRLPSHTDTTNAIALADVDGDGDLDALIGNGGKFPTLCRNRLYLGDGAGNFADASAQLPASSEVTRALGVGDVDGDGDLDAVAANSSRDRLFLNDGAGNYSEAPGRLPAQGARTTVLALGDLDSDGDLDILRGEPYQIPNALALLLNDGAGSYALAPGRFPEDTGMNTALTLADLDGDGDLDALVGKGSSFQNMQNRLLLNDGDGAFTSASSREPPGAEGAAALAVGDVDGDGDLDAILANPLFYALQMRTLRLHLNDGSGAFVDASARLPAGVFETTCIALGDVDGDGDLDALIGNGESMTGHPNALLINDGSGGFTEANGALPAHADDTRAIALGDLDGDGDLDALIGNDHAGGSAQNRLYLGDGRGSFRDASAQLPANAGPTAALALGDLDGDGDLDAFVGNGAGFPFQNRLYLGDGAGTFRDATALLPGIPDATFGAALGDVDGDGDLDIMVANGGYVTLENRLLRNDGPGGFSDASAALPVHTDDTRALALADLDRDGDLDALLVNHAIYQGAQDRLYLGDGSGSFTDATAALPRDADEGQALALADVDGDGDLDALIGNAARGRLYSNLSTQLAWRGIPRLGKPLILDLWGPVSGAWQLAVSDAPAAIPLASLGTLRLDPAQLWSPACGPLDAAGRGSIAFAVPGDPALSGVALHWQALLAFPLKLGNLEVTTLSNL